MDRFDEETPLRIVRSCLPRSLIKRAQALKNESKGLDEFLDKFSQILPGLQRDGDNIYLEFSEGCSCPIVRIYNIEFPPTWCHCNTGWKELFESVLGRPIEVDLEKSVLQGDDVCEVRVTL